MRSTTETRLVAEAFRFELDPNMEQRTKLAQSVGARRFVFNWGLAESQRAYELTGKRPRLGELKTQLVELKKSECSWLYDVSAHIGQQALVDLDRAFERFFKGLKGEGPRAGFPRFKRRSERDSARLYEVMLHERHIDLPKIGGVRLKETRSKRGFEGRIIAATIRRRADRWFVSLVVEREREIVLPGPPAFGRDVVGVDLGLASAAVISDGAQTRVIEPTRALRRNLRKLRRLDRQLARKQGGSCNREKAKLRRARLHYRISCERSDFLHKLSSELTKTKSAIVLEDLSLEGMRRNRSLALSIGDAGLGELRRQLEYKSQWYGSTVIVADRFFPSTQLCSPCGSLNESVKGFEGLKERTFDCPACGLSLDRDENAAVNLRGYGLKELGIDPLPEGLRDVKPDGEEGAGSTPRRGAKPASMKQEATAGGNRRPTRRSSSQGELVTVRPARSSHRETAPPGA